MMDLREAIGRRGLLAAAGLGSTGLFAGRLFGRRPAAAGQPGPAVGHKFTADGDPLRSPGNSVVFRITPGGGTAGLFSGLVAMNRDLARQPFANDFTFLPPQSYHMTLFDGLTDHGRKPGHWPGGLPTDMPMGAATDAIAARLRRASLGFRQPVRMRVNPRQADDIGQVISLRLLPANGGQDAALRAARAGLASAFGLPFHQPDTYQFHVSLAYLLVGLSAKQDDAVARWLAGWAAGIAARAGTITLGAPEFVSYQDMTSYHTVMSLR